MRYVLRFRQFLTLYGKNTTGSNLLLSLTPTSERKDIKTYSNPINAAYTVRLVLDIFKRKVCAVHPTETTPGQRSRIVVIAPYDGQKNLYKEMFARISNAEFVRGLVEVHTILGVQGHEADLVIFDMTRTSNFGFLCQHVNANVALRWC
ncbi:PhoH-like protein [Apiospora rasikravindrae]|uniref:PhoH-like protein n=1 Tax=Apiospora rasikravindrae TaxID=990691 RepID=A0ABR1SI45_9PEZI